MKKNPYSLVFGKEPIQYISRMSQMVDIQEIFNDEQPSQQIYMITGIRGSGKTVFMSDIARNLKTDDRWISVELSSSRDLLTDLAASLASENQFAKIFQNASINLSFFGIGFEVKGSVPITNIQVALSKMLKSLDDKGLRVLICVDEVVVNDAMKDFASVFQILVRQDLPVFLLMTGLYENINNLQNEDNLTFLYRAPKIELKPLNITSVADNYANVFILDRNNSLEMAKMTLGYSFAFQVLGYFTWEYDGDYHKATPEYRQYLEEYVYEKIWSEMSEGDKKLAYGVAMSKTGKAKDIREILGLSDNEYSPYRDRLVKRGILDGREHGYVRFTLPFFGDYVIVNYDTGSI